jgi:F5/8 type C domain
MSRVGAAGTLAAVLLAAGSRQSIEFLDPAAWKAVTSPGALVQLSGGGGVLKAAYDFGGGAGWAGVSRAVALDLPENWTLGFRLRGSGPPNTLEVKLVDATGENVWWYRRQDFAPTAEGQAFSVKKRQVSFAWGPAGGGTLRHAAALEIVLSAGQGGKGVLEIADLRLTELPPPGVAPPPPTMTASSGALTLDFGERRELSGLVIDWEKGRAPRSWEVQTSDDGGAWTGVRRAERAGAERTWIHLPEMETRWLRLVLPPGDFGTPRIDVKPVDWAPTPNDFLAAIARDSPRGAFPRSFSGEQSYWTVVGVDGDGGPSLLGEDGALEPWKGSFSIEPFVLDQGTAVSWSGVSARQTLEEDSLPIPTVTWRHPRLSLEVAAVATGERARSTLRARYRLMNAGPTALRGSLLLAVRPFQVNPPTQFLNAPGGVSPVKSLAWDGATVTVNGDRGIFPAPAPDSFAAHAFDEGPLPPLLAGGGAFPKVASLVDPTGLASGVLAWRLDLPAGDTMEVELAIPLHPATPRPDRSRLSFPAAREEAVRGWHQRLDGVRFIVPPAAREVVDTVRASLAYILVTREGPALRPGARSYARSWIRDGALMSAALLRFGVSAAVKEFLVWFGARQFPDGRVPCCVDARGADPVAEHDSHGELLYLAAEYLRMTGDVGTVRTLWASLARVVGAIETLRSGETSAEFRGLLPASISHEGYSAKPVHSFWDDFWGWKGLSDAGEIAAALGRPDDAARIHALRDSFGADVRTALLGTIARHGLDTIPGSVELHDFDPTATTVALDPCGLEGELPRRELLTTFDRYFAKVRARAAGGVEDAYTPYEIRSVGTFVRLGRRDEALELLGRFMADRRPAGWRQWPEVVRRDPRAPGFLGDLPHTWVGSDFVRSATDLFAYVRENDGAIVLGAGLPESWLREGPVGIEGLVTPWGRLSYRMAVEKKRVRVSIAGGVTPPGGLVVSWPLPGLPSRVSVNGKGAGGRDVVVRETPAEVVLEQ